MKESISFNGRTYNRYPNSKCSSDRNYFKCSGRIYHRDLWVFHNTEIPDGFVIHHRDFDSLNNRLDNLECLSKESHVKLHADRNRGKCTDDQRKHLEEIRPMTKEWHKSEEGRIWHSEHGKKVAARMPEVSMVCEVCDSMYSTKVNMAKQSKFCSNKCKSKWRRDSGIDNETRICFGCECEYIDSRYSKSKYCSVPCVHKSKKAAR